MSDPATHRRLTQSVAMPVLGGFVLLLLVVAVVTLALWPFDASEQASDLAVDAQPTAATQLARQQQIANPRFQPAGNLTVWWDNYPRAVPTASLVPGNSSNIHPADYAGPESCQECHQKNYEAWSQHSHRWMNAIADKSTVKGDFSGNASISYLGGTGTFFRDGQAYRMRLEREASTRLYDIHQTIGSRFFQYYVGRLIEGPESPDDQAYHVDHVLPFGYWLDRREWIPVVHVGFDELPDGRRDDPFSLDPARRSFSPYYQCNSCHTTFPLADQMMREFWTIGRHAPFPMHFAMATYLAENHADTVKEVEHPADVTSAELEQLFHRVRHWEAPEHAVALGVTCEACHLGSKAHADRKLELPSFFPYSPHLQTEVEGLKTGRTHANVNWVCGRCHAGHRPYYAGGMATWNSTEFSDAMKGGCYSQLRCVDCHDPHETIGQSWRHSEAENDARCLKCHEEFSSDAALVQHTHHQPESTGSRCMNCHMPRLNEGLQDVVRTHTIFSPNEGAMIEANQPNACGLCHTDKPIDWATDHLSQWYGSTFREESLAANYPHRQQSMAFGWLKSPHESVRLVATDAVTRQKDTSSLSALIAILDDPFLLNRQFARIALERWFNEPLERFGYRFYMTPEEREGPLAVVRESLLQQAERQDHGK